MNTYTPAQVFIRGFVYLAIAVATELLSVLSAGNVEPRMAGVKIFIAGLLTLRAYLDKTPSQTEEQSLDFRT